MSEIKVGQIVLWHRAGRPPTHHRVVAVTEHLNECVIAGPEGGDLQIVPMDELEPLPETHPTALKHLNTGFNWPWNGDPLE